MRLSTSVLLFTLLVSGVAVRVAGLASLSVQGVESDRTAEVLIAAESSNCGLHDGRRCDDRS